MRTIGFGLGKMKMVSARQLSKEKRRLRVNAFDRGVIQS